MKLARLSLSLLAVAAVGAHAGDLPAQSCLQPLCLHATPQVVFDCHAVRLPSLTDMGGVLDTNSGSRLFTEREHFVHSAHRECMRGAARVMFFRDAGSQVRVLAIAGER